MGRFFSDHAFTDMSSYQPDESTDNIYRRFIHGPDTEEEKEEEQGWDPQLPGLRIRGIRRSNERRTARSTGNDCGFKDAGHSPNLIKGVRASKWQASFLSMIRKREMKHKTGPYSGSVREIKDIVISLCMPLFRPFYFYKY